MKTHIIRSVFLLLTAFAIIGGCHSKNGGQIIVITPNGASDIPGGAVNATLREAAIFAWQDFIAFNWPALSKTRDVPDSEAIFGVTNPADPVVWQTFRHKVEIFPGTGNPPGFDANSPDFGYSSVPPKYVYGEGEVKPCTGQAPIAEPAWTNLDELSQLGLASMFAGASPKNSAVNNDPQLVRFMAGANGIYYVYVADPVTSYWSHSEAYHEAVDNFTAVASGNGNPSKPQGPVISFPFGTIEVKAAFRELTNAEKASGRFFQTRVRYYEQDDADPNNACYHEAVWGMVGFHIMHKTETAPTYIFFTFEQTDNLLNTDGEPVENEDGKIINPSPSETSTTPAQVYTDGDPPSLEIVGDEFCEDIGKRLYYMEEEPFGGIPTGGSICVNERDRTIPPAVVDVNRVAHNAIERYNTKNGLADSPWLYYKLVNVQWRPFDFSEIDEDNPDGINNPATFYLNNIMVETDFSLQNLATRLYKDMGADGPGGGLPTVMPPNFDGFDPTRKTWQNTLTFDDDGNLKKTYGMGGCMGCHGNDAQGSGNAFSFILRFGRVANGPEATSVTSPGATNPVNQ